MQTQRRGGSGKAPVGRFPNDAPTATTSSTSHRTCWIETLPPNAQIRNGQAPLGILLRKTLPGNGHQLRLDPRGLTVSGARPVSSDRRPSGWNRRDHRSYGSRFDRNRHYGQPDKVSLLDLHSRRVIGWAVRSPWRRMKRDLAIRALKMAIAFRSPPKGCIHHTDRNTVLTTIRKTCASTDSACR